MHLWYPSTTAEAMAAARAFGSFVHGTGRLFDDPFAVEFLAPKNKTLFLRIKRWAVGPLRWGVWKYYNHKYPGAIGWAMARHRYIDDMIVEALGAGISQLAIIGAGYDSRAFRLSALKEIPILEIDHPNTQRAKLRVIDRLFGSRPTNVTYLPFDADNSDLKTILSSGLQADKKTLVILEGFLWYLEPRISEGLLKAITATAMPGSMIVFDYILPSMVDGLCSMRGAKEHRTFVAKFGEPIRSGIDPNNLADYLQKHGYHLLTDTDAVGLNNRYGAMDMHPYLHIARAEVIA
jgi:methyltransferase (TIGR00027 family)